MLILNKKANDYIYSPNHKYVGRGSLLGNPWTHIPYGTKAEFIVPTREEAILEYEAYLWKKVLCEKDKAFIKELASITDDTILVCYCVPLSCHAEVICRVARWVNLHVIRKNKKETV